MEGEPFAFPARVVQSEHGGSSTQGELPTSWTSDFNVTEYSPSHFLGLSSAFSPPLLSALSFCLSLSNEEPYNSVQSCEVFYFWDRYIGGKQARSQLRRHYLTYVHLQASTQNANEYFLDLPTLGYNLLSNFLFRPVDGYLSGLTKEKKKNSYPWLQRLVKQK